MTAFANERSQPDRCGIHSGMTHSRSRPEYLFVLSECVETGLTGLVRLGNVEDLQGGSSSVLLDFPAKAPNSISGSKPFLSLQLFSVGSDAAD